MPVPRGRLARLGVVLDLGEPIDRLRGLAILCDRAGIDAVWLVDRQHVEAPAQWSDPSAAAAVVATALTRAQLGVAVPPRDAGTAAHPGPVGPVAVQEVMLAQVRARAYGQPRVSIILEDLEGLAEVLGVVDDVVLPGWRFADLEAAADEVRAQADEAGRDPVTLGVAALLPVSIGRTQAEAAARADADELFARIGHPADHGIFGTLEECQDRVIALAHAGIADLRCLLPTSDDIHDVIAQLTSITVGTTDVLVPGSLRSSAPPPPEGWGGRGEAASRPRVSGGSRRR